MELLKQMITQGENVNQMKEGSPLHWACYGNNLECVKYLLDQGFTFFFIFFFAKKLKYFETKVR